ncbi:MAG: NAD(P)/FAD-dependent oxidoreductase, partial [Proteocatella sp.]
SRGIFKKDDAEVGPLMEEILKEDEVELITGFKVKKVKKAGSRISVMLKNEDDELELNADALLIAMGKKPETGSLGLESAGIELDERGFIKTDAMMRTTCKNIFACGDVAGPYQFTHMAGYQAGIIIRNIIFRMRAKADYSKVSWSTFTSPEVAHAGLTEQMAREEGKYVRHILIPLEKMDRAKADSHRKGFLKLIVGRKNRVIGATVVGPKAGDMISLASLAISKKMKTEEFAGLIFPYPTESEIFKTASLELVKMDFKPWQKKLVKTIFLR